MRSFNQISLKNRSRLLFFFLIITAFLMQSFSTKLFVLKPKEIGLSFLGIIQGAVSGTKDFFVNTANSIQELNRLQEEYNALQRKIIQYQLIETNAQSLQEENKRLKDLLGYGEQLNYEYISAEVIAKDPGNVFSTIVINKGAFHSIEKNQTVIAYNDGIQGLVGRIQEVGYRTSTILPIYDSNCFVAARVEKSRYEGLVNGNNTSDNPLSMNYIEKRSRSYLQYSDLIITSGMNSIYPKGINIGIIKEIGGKDWENNLELSLEPIIDFSRLEYVFVLKTTRTGQDQE